MELKTQVAVIGAGHAGIEAALAAARMGLDTVLFTTNLDAVGKQIVVEMLKAFQDLDHFLRRTVKFAFDHLKSDDFNVYRIAVHIV